MRNRQVARGFRLVERSSIETQNSFEPLRMANDDSHGAKDKASTVGKRPASSPVQEEKGAKKHMYQENIFGTISKHEETDPRFLQMEAETSISKTNDTLIQPSDNNTQVQRETSHAVNRQITVNAEIHCDKSSCITGQSDSSEIIVDNIEYSQ